MDRTEQFRGRLIDGDRVLIEPLQGYLKTHNKTAGQAEWSGYFEFPPEVRDALTVGGLWHLVHVDGSCR